LLEGPQLCGYNEKSLFALATTLLLLAGGSALAASYRVHYILRGSGRDVTVQAQSTPEARRVVMDMFHDAVVAGCPQSQMKCLPHFDTACLPTGNRAGDYIIVSRNSPLISAVCRLRSGQYRIEAGSFIGGGASHHATPRKSPSTSPAVHIGLSSCG
jgi:hypothetical protein